MYTVTIKKNGNKAPHIVLLLEEYVECIIVLVNVVTHAPHDYHVLFCNYLNQNYQVNLAFASSCRSS
jgi:hypothetical protein